MFVRVLLCSMRMRVECRKGDIESKVVLVYWQVAYSPHNLSGWSIALLIAREHCTALGARKIFVRCLWDTHKRAHVRKKYKFPIQIFVLGILAFWKLNWFFLQSLDAWNCINWSEIGKILLKSISYTKYFKKTFLRTHSKKYLKIYLKYKI